jgi:hypothetical protein
MDEPTGAGSSCSETAFASESTNRLGHMDEAVTLRFYVKDSFTDDKLFAGV